MKIRHLYLLLLAIGVMAASIARAEDLEPPVPVRTIAPAFPVAMRRLGNSGLVIINCLIDEKGNVAETKVVKASDDAFSEPALEALKKWRFKPAKKDGEAVAIRVNIPVKFNLD